MGVKKKHNKKSGKPPRLDVSADPSALVAELKAHNNAKKAAAPTTSSFGGKAVLAATATSGSSSTLASTNDSANVPKGHLDVGYDGATLTQQMLRQRHKEIVLRRGWKRQPELHKLAEEFLTKNKLFRLAVDRTRMNLGHTLFKPSVAQLAAYEQELTDFVDAQLAAEAGEGGGPNGGGEGGSIIGPCRKGFFSWSSSSAGGSLGSGIASLRPGDGPIFKASAPSTKSAPQTRFLIKKRLKNNFQETRNIQPSKATELYKERKHLLEEEDRAGKKRKRGSTPATRLLGAGAGGPAAVGKFVKKGRLVKRSRK